MNRLPHSWFVVLVGACLLAPGTGSRPICAAAPQPAEAIRLKLQEILERPEFAPTGRGQSPWLARVFRAFFEWLGGLHDTLPVLYWLLLLFCLAVLVALVWLCVAKVRRAFYLKDSRREETGMARRVEASRIYREEASERAARGEHTEAIRCLFLSLVFLFDESGRVLFPRAYTNREYLHLFEERADVRDDLTVFVDVLDDHWYGLRPAAVTQYQTCLARYEHLLGQRR